MQATRNSARSSTPCSTLSITLSQRLTRWYMNLSPLPFSQVVWLVPLAFALHVSEEWPRFVPWANHFASARFTRREYLIIHVSGFVSFVGVAVMFSLFSYRRLVFLFFAFMVLPALLWNIG